MFSIFSCHLMSPFRSFLWRCTFLSPRPSAPFKTRSKHRLRFFFTSFSEIKNLDKKHAKRLKCDWLTGLFVQMLVCVFVRLRFERSSWWSDQLAAFLDCVHFPSFCFSFTACGLRENKFPGDPGDFLCGVERGSRFETQSGTLTLINYTFPWHEKVKNKK